MNIDSLRTYFQKFRPAGYDASKAEVRAELEKLMAEFEARKGPVKTIPTEVNRYNKAANSNLRPSKAMEAKKSAPRYYWVARVAINARIKDAGLSKYDLAAKIGICYGQLQNNLNGHTPVSKSRAVAIEAAVRKMLAEVSP